MEVNFFGPIELTRLALPHLTRGTEPAVVNVTSMCGRKGMPAWPEYSASKFALVGMAEAWRGEFARFDVDVLTIVPGMTNSGFQNNWLRTDGKADLRFEEGMTPEYLAAKITSAIRKNRTETVVGSEAKRLLRFNRYFPRLTNWLIARKVKRLYAK
jgi:short-subunit dehydrogenase